ncbi:MAG: hypothetical protein IJN63_08110 [Clostridia bacterium]|nr:hypothetical protein [Clostridia bacterium]
MDMLKKLWPTPFKIKKGNIASFLIQLIIFLVIVAVVGWLIGLLAHLPIVGLVFKLLGSLIGIYNLVGIILCILRFIGTI